MHKSARMEYDSESGLYHTLYRKYSPTFGRWFSTDPEACGADNPQAFNMYAYVLDNPVNFVDPLGLQCSNPFCSDLYYAVSHAECRDLPPGPSNPFPPPGWLPALCIGCWFGSDEGGGESAKAAAAVGGSELIWEPDLLKPLPEEAVSRILRGLYRPSACMTVGGIVVVLAPSCMDEMMGSLVEDVLTLQQRTTARADRNFLERLLKVLPPGAFGLRLVVGGGMIVAGGGMVYASGVAIAGAVAAGPLAWPTIPISAGVGAAGVGMMVTGVDYAATGRMRLLEKLARPDPKRSVPGH